MATLTLKNNTGAIVTITDVGVILPASGQDTYTAIDVIQKLTSSVSLRSLVTASTVTVNNGSTDLSVEVGLDYLTTLWSRAGSDIPLEGLRLQQWLFDDFLGNNNSPFGDTDWIENLSGTSATTNVGASAVNGIGATSLDTSSATASRAIHKTVGTTTGELVLGLGVCTTEFRLVVPTLSTVAQEFIVRAGPASEANQEPINGVYFEYNRLVTGDVWVGRTASASTRSTTAGSAAVVAGAAVVLKIVVNAAATSVEFFVNGTSIGTLATNIPTTTLGAVLRISRSAGNQSRSVIIDYWTQRYVFTNPR